MDDASHPGRRHITTGEIVKKHKTLSTLAAIAAISIATPLAAQSRSTVDMRTLDAAVIVHTDANRSAVTAALTSTRALAVAGTMGLSPEDVSTRLAALDDASVKQVADEILAGGESRVVISTTAIIIGLLIIILLTRL
jgi:L-serine deaminase